MTTTATFLSRLTIAQTYDTTVTAGGTTTLPNEANKQYTDTSTPSVTEGDYFEQNLTAGAATIDLTALTSLRGRSVSLSGKKVRFLRVTAKTGNANPLTIAKGASNGFTGFGASFSVTLQPGQSWLFDDAGNGTAVSGTVKTLDLSGTGTEGIQFSVAAGG